MLKLLVAPELGGLLLGDHLRNRVLHREIQAHRRRLGPLALGVHGRLETGQIHQQAMLLGNLLGEFQREAVGVVELKGLGAADLAGAGRQHLGQQLFTPLQGFQKAGLLPLQLRQNHLAPRQQLGESLGHQRDRRLPHRR